MGGLAAALAVACLGAVASAAPAAALQVRIAVSAPGKPCRVKVAVNRRIRATAVLRERKGSRWRTVARRPMRRRSVTLHCAPAVQGASVRRFRVLVRRGGRIVARSRVARMRVAPAPVPPAPLPAPSPSPPATTPPPPPPPPSAPAPLDPAQFGVEGTGGPPSPQTLALLANPKAVFNADGVADLRAGRIDPRIVAVLGSFAQAHVITVSTLCSDAPQFTPSGAVSAHYLGRAVDVALVDGVAVDPGNAVARALVADLSLLRPADQPDEVGTPWLINLPGYFSDASTQDRLHIAFTQPIAPSWTPPPA
jgi:hypothetical protein